MACKSCGARTRSNQRFCEYCGAELQACSTAQAQPAPPSPQPIVVNIYNTNENHSGNKAADTYPYKSRWTAFFLCLILGYLGLHRFYVGKVGTGLIYLLTGGFFLFGWAIDTLMILTGFFKDKYGHRLA